MRSAISILWLALMTVGCGGSNSTPAPSPTPPPPPAPPAEPQLAMFMDPASAFTTHDVLDANEEVVQFDTGNGSLIWVASGQRFEGYPVANNFIGSDRGFEVRFGTKDGQRHGYFTETSSATICDINVFNGQISITGTDAKVPGS